MNCPNCNQPILSNQKFCGKCGAKIEPAPPKDVKPQALDDVQKTKIFGDWPPAPPKKPQEPPVEPSRAPQQPAEPPQTAQPFPPVNEPKPADMAPPALQQPEAPAMLFGEEPPKKPKKRRKLDPKKTVQPSEAAEMTPPAAPSMLFGEEPPRKPKKQRKLDPKKTIQPSEAADMAQPSKAPAPNNEWQQDTQNTHNDSFLHAAAASPNEHLPVEQQPPAAPAHDDGMPPKKNNKLPLIIIAVSLAVLLIGVGVFLAMKFLDKGKDSEKQESSAVSSSVQTDSGDKNSKSDKSQPDDSKTEDSEPDDSKPESSKTTSQGSHQIYSSSGVLLAENDAIDASDKDAQEKLQSYLDNDSSLKESIEMVAGSNTEVSVYAKGNAVVCEINATEELGSARKAIIKSTTSVLSQPLNAMIGEMRSETGVDNLVGVYAYVDKTGELVTNTVIT